MKSVLISVRPKWTHLIINDKKTVEIRKTRPKIDTPFKCYIYCTKPSIKYQTICGSIILNDDELYLHPENGIKYGSSIELMACDNYDEDNFLNGKVVAEFICNRIDRIYKRGNNNFDYCYLSLNVFGNDDIEIEITDIEKSCISKEELNLYGASSNPLFAWHMSQLKIYDTPKNINDFGLKRAPQSWCYVEEE